MSSTKPTARSKPDLNAAFKASADGAWQPFWTLGTPSATGGLRIYTACEYGPTPDALLITQNARYLTEGAAHQFKADGPERAAALYLGANGIRRLSYDAKTKPNIWNDTTDWTCHLENGDSGFNVVRSASGEWLFSAQDDGVQINGTLGVGGKTTLDGELSVGKKALDAITLNGNTTLKNALTVDGLSTLNGELHLNNLLTAGQATLSGPVKVDGTLAVGGEAVAGSVLSVKGKTTLNGALDVDAATTHNAPVTVTVDPKNGTALQVTGTLRSSGDVHLGKDADSAIILTGKTQLNGSGVVRDNLDVQGKLTAATAQATTLTAGTAHATTLTADTATINNLLTAAKGLFGTGAADPAAVLTSNGLLSFLTLGTKLKRISGPQLLGEIEMAQLAENDPKYKGFDLVKYRLYALVLGYDPVAAPATSNVTTNVTTNFVTTTRPHLPALTYQGSRATYLSALDSMKKMDRISDRSRPAGKGRPGCAQYFLR